MGFSQSDQRARDLLDQVSEVYAGYETMSMTFAYQLDNAAEGISQKERRDNSRLPMTSINSPYSGFNNSLMALLFTQSMT